MRPNGLSGWAKTPFTDFAIMLQVEEAHDWDALDPQEWDALVKASPASSVFLTYAWLTACWTFLAPGRRLRMLLIRRDGRLVGGLPLAEERTRLRGLPVRKLLLLTDPVTTNVRSDLVAPENSAECLDAVIHHLRSRRSSWDVLHLDSLPATSPLLTSRNFFRMASPEKYWVLHRLAVTGSWEEYLAGQTTHFCEHYRRERAKLVRLGDVDAEFADTPQAVAEAVDVFFRVEAASGKQQRADYTPLQGALKQYYYQLFRNLAAARYALVATLKLNGEPVASILAAQLNGTIYTLNDVFDQRLRKQYAGHYLRGELVRYAWQQGYRAVDFNGYGSHIERWRTQGQPHYRLIAYSPSWYGGLLAVYKRKLVPTLRRYFPAPVPPQKPGDRGITDQLDASAPA